MNYQSILTIIIIITMCVVAYLLYKRRRGISKRIPPLQGGGKRYVKERSTQFPQTAILTNYILRSTPIRNFVSAEKTDGMRTEIFIEGKVITEFFSKKELGKLKRTAKKTVLNTEFLNDKYYIFDSPEIDGEDISEKHFLERYEAVKSFVEKYDSEEAFFKVKEYSPITKPEELEEFIQNTVSPNTGNKIDGVILQRIDLPYYTVSSYKYKRPVMNTVDFLLKYLPEKNEFYLYLWGTYRNIFYGMQRLPKTNRLSKQHTGVDLKDKTTRFPDKFLCLFSSPLIGGTHRFVPKEHWSRKGYKREDIIEINELMNKIIADPINYDGKVVEMSWSEGGWVPYRERGDKPKPNGYFVGDSICEILFSPVNFSGNRYFESNIEESKLTITFHKVNKLIRKKMIEKLLSDHPTNTVLDIAGGRGGDSNYFVENGVNTIFAVDADREAIVSYKNRLAKMNKKDLIFNGFGWELGEDNTELIKDIEHRYEYREPFSVAVMNYAIHYLCDSSLKIMELSRTLNKLLKDDGVFMFTYFDGDLILQNAVDGVVKLHSFTITVDTERGIVNMPLPTIDKTGYREEPLTTREKLSQLNIKVLDDYYPAQAWSAELKELDPHEDILDLSRFIHVITCQVLKSHLI